MTTKPPASVKEADENSTTKIIYKMVEELKDIIPVTNERYRLAFCLNKFFNGDANSIKESLISAKPESSTMDMKELEKLVTQKYNSLKLSNDK